MCYYINYGMYFYNKFICKYQYQYYFLETHSNINIKLRRRYSLVLAKGITEYEMSTCLPLFVASLFLFPIHRLIF